MHSRISSKMFATWFSQNPGGGILLHTKDFYLQLQIVKYTRLHTSNKTIFKNMWSMFSVLQSRFFTPLQIPPKSYDICNTTCLSWNDSFFNQLVWRPCYCLGKCESFYIIVTKALPYHNVNIKYQKYSITTWISES